MASTSTLLQRFEAFVNAHSLFRKNNRLLLAVSGGLDSIVLCHLCHEAGYTFAVAHCNFGLRGEESNRDEVFVQAIAVKYQVPFFVQHFDTKVYAQEHKLSTQESARKLRYDWFRELVNVDWSVLNQKKLIDGDGAVPHSPLTTLHSLLLTAHHLDDNVETVAMNFFKGTGITGLRGMQPKHDFIVRPLLFARRHELEQYATTNNLQWVEDSSNSETIYTRNFFRHEVLPQIAQKFPQVVDNIAHNIERFNEVSVLYLQAIEGYKKSLLVPRGEEVFIPVLKLAKAVPLHTIVYEILKPYHFSPAQTEAAVALLSSDSGKFIRSATHQVLKHRRWLVIAPLRMHGQTRIVVEKENGEVLLPQSVLTIVKKASSGTINTNAAVAQLDAKALKFPLIIRPWKAGDYFYPLGMRKKKKLSRFFIDIKLSKSDKEKVWVLESHNRIAWIIGLRIDDRFKITSSTQQIYQITSTPLPADTSAHPV